MRRCHAGETEANEALRSFCRAVAVQIYNLNVLLDLEKVAIGGGISKQPILVESPERGGMRDVHPAGAIPSAKRRPAACPARRSCPAGS
mgnify:CR=1 FL=1